MNIFHTGLPYSIIDIQPDNIDTNDYYICFNILYTFYPCMLEYPKNISVEPLFSIVYLSMK